jgi:hypothetical protein
LQKGDTIMKIGISRHQLVTALAGIAFAGAATMGTAHATAIAYAKNELLNFRISADPGATLSVIGTPLRDTVTAVTFGPPTVVDGHSDPKSGFLASDAAQATAGTGAFPGPNAFARVTAPGYVPRPGIDPAGPYLQNGIRADAETAQGSPINTGVAFVRNVAEAQVLTNSGYAASGSGLNAANAALSLMISVAGSGIVTLDFTDVYEIFASTTTAGEGAQATISNIFTITPVGGIPFVFSVPLINTTCVSNSGIPPTCNISGTQLYSVSTPTALTAGTYAISLFSSSAVTVSSLALVPEPETGAMIGLGLASMGLILRRRRQQDQPS